MCDGATIAPDLVPWVLKKIFSIKKIKNDICSGGASKQMPFFQKVCPKKTYPCPQCIGPAALPVDAGI